MGHGGKDTHTTLRLWMDSMDGFCMELRTSRAFRTATTAMSASAPQELRFISVPEMGKVVLGNQTCLEHSFSGSP